MVNTCVKYDHCMSKGNGVIVQKLYNFSSLNLILIFDSKSYSGPHQVMINTCMKYLFSFWRIVRKKEMEFSSRNHFATDGQTALLKPVYPHNFVDGV